VNGLGFGLDDVDAMSLTPFNVIKSQVEYDRRDGTITGLRDKELEAQIIAGGQTVPQFVREAIQQVVAPVTGREDMDLPPREIARALRKRLSLSQVEYVFYLMPAGNGGYFLGYRYEDENQVQSLLLNEGQPPQEVLDRITSELHIVI
jgi:hypothetical protein